MGQTPNFFWFVEFVVNFKPCFVTNTQDHCLPQHEKIKYSGSDFWSYFVCRL